MSKHLDADWHGKIAERIQKMERPPAKLRAAVREVVTAFRVVVDTEAAYARALENFLGDPNQRPEVERLAEALKQATDAHTAAVVEYLRRTTEYRVKGTADTIEAELDNASGAVGRVATNAVRSVGQWADGLLARAQERLAEQAAETGPDAKQGRK